MRMKKHIKRLVCVLLTLCCLSLSSCSGVFSDPKSLMSPPKSGGELAGIEDTLNKAVGSLFSFVYPPTGNYRSSCTMHDITGDGNDEAIVFYKLTDSGEIHMNYLYRRDSVWTSVFDMKLNCVSIDRIEFADLCGDSNPEVLIGCSLYNDSEKTLYIYSVKDNVFSQISQEIYTDFSVCDIVNKSKPQIILFNFGSNTVIKDAESNNLNVQKYASAKLLSFSSADVTNVLGNVSIDRSITSISSVTQSNFDGQQALYVDAYKGTAAMVTEIIYYDNKNRKLVNVYENMESGENAITKRFLLANSRDIDNDGTLEIPFGVEVPGYDGSATGDKQYYSIWKRCSKTAFTTVSSGYYNLTDRYFIKLPENWLGGVTLSLDKKQSSETFYIYDKNGNISTQLLSIRIFDRSSFNADKNDYQSVATDGERVFAAKVDDSDSKYSISIDYVRSNILIF